MEGMTKRILLALLFAVLFVHPVFIFMQDYLMRDCDDKAVHYFSAAFFAAGAPQRQAVLDALPAWLERLPTEHLKLRMAGRIAYPKTYVAADVLIRAARAILLPGRAVFGDGGWYELPVKAALLAMLVLAMMWLVLVSLRLPRGPWLALCVLALAASGVIHLSPLVPMPARGMDPISCYGPRGSVPILALSLLVSYAAGNPLLVALSALWLVLWHAGLGLISLPVFAIALAISERVPACRTGRPRACLAAVLGPWCVALLLLSKASIAIPVTRPQPPLLAYLPSPVSAGLSATAVVLITWWCARRRIADALGPRIQALFLAGLIFVAVSQAFVCVQRSIIELGLSSPTRVHLVYEIPARLSGITYLIGSNTAVIAVWLVFRLIAARFGVLTSTFLARPLWQGLAILLMTAILVIGRMDTYATVLSGQANYLGCDCASVRLHGVDAAGLAQLDPRIEPDLFYSVAEFLFSAR
jgi:hypothetical protein